MFEINVKQNIFVKALSHVQSVVERKNISAISSHLKLDASANQLIITGTDSVLSVTISIMAEIITPGSLTLPAHTLYDIVRKLSEENISLKISQEQSSMLEISSGHSIFHLGFLDSDNFSSIMPGNFDCSFNFSAANLFKILDKNRNTIAQEDPRYNLNGVYLHMIEETNQLRGTATDGHRLSSVFTSIPTGAEKLPSVIIPRKTVFELLKILAEQNDEVKLEVSAVKIQISYHNITLVSKLIDGEFPNYLPLIPYDNQQYFKLDCFDFAKAIDRTATIIIEKSQAIKFIISGTNLEIKVDGEQKSLAQEFLEIECNALDNFEISFNARYLLDIISSIGANSGPLTFKFSDSFSPILIKSDNDQFSEFVLMPMR